MLAFIGRRLTAGVVLVFAITTLAYLLLYLGSGDIARRILGQTATQEQVAAKTTELGLDRPLWEQYAGWLSGAFTGDLGRSWFTGQLVIDGVATRLGVTLSLVIGATVITTLVSVVLGVWAALAGGCVDRTIQFLTVLGMAAPGFLIAVGLVLVLAIRLAWLNATGHVALVAHTAGWSGSVSRPVGGRARHRGCFRRHPAEPRRHRRRAATRLRAHAALARPARGERGLQTRPAQRLRARPGSAQRPVRGHARRRRHRRAGVPDARPRA